MRVMAGLSATAASLLMFGLAVPSALAAQATALYVDQASAACSDQGSGTQAAPFCTIQAAADVVSPGQTVEITPTGAQRYIQPVTITRSGTAQQPITFTSASAGANVVILPGGETGGPVLTVKNAQYVNVSGLTIGHLGTDEGIGVIGSSSISLDSLIVAYSASAGITPHAAGISIDSASADVTVSRTKIAATGGPGLVADGAHRVTVTTDAIEAFASPGIDLVSAAAAVVTSNLVFASCNNATSTASPASALTIAQGTSADVENNALEVTNVATCPAYGSGLSVDASSAGPAGGVAADYNSVWASSAQAVPVNRYSWAGVSYPTAGAFSAAVAGQGAQDLDIPGTLPFTIAAPEHSAVIDSADCDAPGELGTDLAGRPRVDDTLVADAGRGTCHADRGPYERQDTIAITDTTSPTTVSNSPAGPVPFTFGETVTSATSTWGAPVNYTVGFGDGSASVPATAGVPVTHDYQSEGQYTVTITGTIASGATAVKTETAYALSAQPHPAALTAAPWLTNGAYQPDTAAIGLGYAGFSWEVAGFTLSYGDGSAADGAQLGTYTHTYPSPGTYPVTFTVTDLAGRTATVTTTMTVGDQVQPMSSYVVYNHAVPAHGVVSIPMSTLTRSSPTRAALLNVIVANPQKSGSLTIWPYNLPRPSLATVPFQAGRTAENSVLATDAINGVTNFYNGSAGPISLELVRYGATLMTSTDSPVVTGDTYTPVTPARVLPATMIAGAHHVAITVPGHYGVPANAAAVVLDITESGSAAAGHLVTWSEKDQGHTALPGAYWAEGQSATSLATVSVNGRVIVSNASTGAASFNADVVGYFVKGGTGSVFLPASPSPRRLLQVQVAGKHWVKLGVAGKTGLPAAGPNGTGTTAVMVNLTASGATAAGAITGYADGTARPGTTNLSYAAAGPVAGAAIIRVGADGAIDLYNSGLRPVTLTVDLTGSCYAYPAS